MHNSSIEKFWSWFEMKQKQIGDDIYNSDFLDQIDRTMVRWGFGWEVGPGFSKPYSFTVSPSGNEILIDGVNAVITKAPAFDNWEVFPFKQAKSNWRTLVFDRNATIETSGWTYRLLKFPGKEIELEVKADNLACYPEDTKALIVDLIITNLLGEKVKMQSIYDIVIVNTFDSMQGVTKIEHLPAHLAKEKYI